MAENVDLVAARVVMETAVELAESEPSKRQLDWVALVASLSDACDRVGVRSYIAALGTALLAKATNRRVDVFSLKASDDSPGAYSARSPAEQVLVPASRKHRFSLGVDGHQPLNNQPFFRSARINKGMVTRANAAPLLSELILSLHEASNLVEAEATEALAAFVRVRRGRVATYAAAPETAHLIRKISELIDACEAQLGAVTDAGRTPQALVAGLCEAAFGEERVVSAKTFDPDRKFPGDVMLLREDGLPGRSIEVRHKVVEAHGVDVFAEKLAKAELRLGAIAALAPGQGSVTTGEVSQRFGVEMTMFDRIGQLIDRLYFPAMVPEEVFVSRAVDAIRERMIIAGCSSDSVKEWDKRTVG